MSNIPKPEEIEIKGQLLANPNVCRFTVNYPVYPQGKANCTDPKTAPNSPLLQDIFALGGVTQIMVAANSLTIEKDDDKPWPSIGSKIGELLRSHISSGKPLIGDDLAHSTRLPDDELRRRIELLLAEKVPPVIYEHGGYIQVVDIKDAVVYLRMGGGCQGCSAAALTLKMHIERMLFSHLPEIKEIIDVTDHSSGTNPYYK
jgi:Fe-S cluster biogenesis protein NfuA